MEATTVEKQIENLSDNNKWLLKHIIIAFWHGFGVSNGLKIDPETDIKTEKLKDGTFHYVTSDKMIEVVNEYIQWLERYQEVWNTDQHDCPEGALDSNHESFNLVLKMVKLMQVTEQEV